MRRTTLNITVCPACAEPFEVVDVFVEDGEDLKYGVAGCGCGSYPVVGGILLYRPGGYVTEEIDDLHLDEPDRALFHLLYGELRGRICPAGTLSVLHRTEWIIQRRKMRRLISRYIDGRRHSAFDLIHHWGDPDWENYVKYRPSSPTYRVLCHLLPALPLADCRRSYILDLCSGAGHFSHLIGRFFPNHRVVSADFSFLNLYFSSRFMAPESDHIRLDANGQLPLADRSFSLVVHVDSFHYITRKHVLSAEMMRIIEHEGIILLAHLHNCRARHVSAGSPLQAAGYEALFRPKEVRSYDEERLFREINGGHGIDLECPQSGAGLDAIREILMVIGSSGMHVNGKRHPVTPVALAGETLSLNPLFRFERRRETLKLRRRFPSRTYRNEYRLLADSLPETLTIRLRQGGTVIDRSGSDEGAGKPGEYFDKGVLVASPDSYFDPSWPSMRFPPAHPVEMSPRSGVWRTPASG